MMPFEEMEQQRLAFLYELYKRSEGDPRRGVPYKELVDALGFGERVTKSIQGDLQQEGLVSPLPCCRAFLRLIAASLPLGLYRGAAAQDVGHMR